MRKDGKTWVGIILIAIGALLIADNFLFLDFNLRHLIFSWHTIILIIGLVILNNSKNSVVGIIFVIIGLFGIFNHIAPFNIYFSFRDYWPVLLIIIGFFILFRRKDSHIPPKSSTEIPGQSFDQQTYSGDMIEESSIFNSTNRLVTSENFRGGRITAIFGSSKINFAKSKLAPGENTLELTCIFGGCDIVVPKDWKVIMNVTAVFGGFEDKRYLSDSSNYTEGVLIIKGAVIFGGGEILSY
jgi:predicted membrane protein